jgi:hypothetical protein
LVRGRGAAFSITVIVIVINVSQELVPRLHDPSMTTNHQTNLPCDPTHPPLLRKTPRSRTRAKPASAPSVPSSLPPTAAGTDPPATATAAADAAALPPAAADADVPPAGSSVASTCSLSRASRAAPWREGGNISCGGLGPGGECVCVRERECVCM